MAAVANQTSGRAAIRLGRLICQQGNGPRNARAPCRCETLKLFPLFNIPQQRGLGAPDSRQASSVGFEGAVGVPAYNSRTPNVCSNLPPVERLTMCSEPIGPKLMPRALSGWSLFSEPRGEKACRSLVPLNLHFSLRIFEIIISK